MHEEIKKAFENGAEIQFKINSEWLDAPKPRFFENVIYRIKPKKKEKNDKEVFNVL